MISSVHILLTKFLRCLDCISELSISSLSTRRIIERDILSELALLRDRRFKLLITAFSIALTML